MTNMKDIISRLFEARDTAHALHLKTKSFSQHVALGTFYEEIVELADKLAESYAGKYGPLIVRANSMTEDAHTQHFHDSLMASLAKMDATVSSPVNAFPDPVAPAVNTPQVPAPKPFCKDDAVAFIKDVADWATTVKFDSDDSFITNQWDEILTLIHRTKYKLENLA